MHTDHVLGMELQRANETATWHRTMQRLELGISLIGEVVLRPEVLRELIGIAVSEGTLRTSVEGLHMMI